MGVEPDVQRVAPDAEGEEGLRVRPAASAMAIADPVEGEIMRELARRRDLRRRVELFAVIHGAERLAEHRRQRLVEMLGVAPDREGGVLLERSLRDTLLRPGEALRIDNGNAREA